MAVFERLLLLCIGLFLGTYWSEDIKTLIEAQVPAQSSPVTSSPTHLNPEDIIALSIEKDLDLLSIQAELPNDWQNIKEVKLLPTSPKMKELIDSRQPSFQLAENGKYQLEIIFIDYSDDEGTGVIAQMSLIDLTSKNKIWEMARSYNLPK